MRRKGSDIFAPAARDALEEACAHLPSSAIIEALSPFATPARIARMNQIFAARVSSVTVLMDAPYDPHNGSAVMRTLDAFGVQDLHVIERRQPFLANSRVSRGSQKWIDTHTYPTSHAALEELEKQGFSLYATHPEGTVLPEALAGVARLCVVMGNEHAGIDDELTRTCAGTVRVPMRGFVESLNLSVTTAILLHAATASRPGDIGEERKRALLARGLLTTVEHAREVLMQRGLLAHAPSPPPNPHPTWIGKNKKPTDRR